jgi:hypothetical protein
VAEGALAAGTGAPVELLHIIFLAISMPSPALAVETTVRERTPAQALVAAMVGVMLSASVTMTRGRVGGLKPVFADESQPFGAGPLQSPADPFLYGACLHSAWCDEQHGVPPCGVGWLSTRAVQRWVIARRAT